ncbi:MAG TPA: cupin domain-containing protein [Verrucomicrobiae bacterium]|nr:cupin domain-containing protein [Verrucomicrobiae bacterium]
MSNNKNATETRFEPARVIQPAALVDYQTGAIVSREILKGATGKVVLFAFDAGEGLSEHISPFNALVQILDGEAEITISGQSHRVKSGEWILMPAQQPHALKAHQRFKMALTMLRS